MTRDPQDNSSPEAEETAEEESAAHSDLFTVLTDSEVDLARKNIAQGKSLYLVRLRFRLGTIDSEISIFEKAVKQYGEIITYLPTKSPTAIDSIELDFLIASDAAAEILEEALARFEVMIHQVPATEEWLAEWDRQQNFVESTMEPTTVDELLAPESTQPLDFIAESYTHRIHVRAHVSTIDKDLEQLKAALEPHGEIVDYEPTNEDADDVDVFDLHVLIESNASLDTLRAALAHLGMTVEEAPQPFERGAPEIADFALDSSEFFQYPTNSSSSRGQSRVKPELLGIFIENPDHPSWANAIEGQTVYRIRVVFSLAIFDRSLDELQNALKPHGDPLAYSPAGVGDDVDSIELDIWFASSEPEDVLRSAIASFAATFD